jgi:hypothetical protein
MPAQWPTFIYNLSNKLISRDSTGPDHIGMFVANEYFNAVKTSQTLFNNTHKSGQKKILEEGFKKAFNMLYTSKEPTLIDKFGNELYDDMFESFPEIDPKIDPLCDMENWILENKDTIDPFLFYQFFPSTCPIKLPGAPPTEINVFGEIDITLENLSEVIKNTPRNEVTMKVTGGDGEAPYIITYKLNGVVFNTTTDSQSVSSVKIPTEPGFYEYVFESAIDSTKKIELKNVNQRASIEITPDGIPRIISVDQGPERQIVEDVNVNSRVEYVTNRILMQNDGSEFFRRWIENIDINSSDPFLKMVKARVLNSMQSGTLFNRNLHDRFFQEEYKLHVKRLPKWLTVEFIVRYVYDPTNMYMGLSDYKKSTNDFVGAFYTNYKKKADKDALEVKLNKYKIEQERFNELKRRWINEISEKEKENEGTLDENDPYFVMADCIIKYWMSTGPAPFTNAPPIPPCNVPDPGVFLPISYGNTRILANDLRKAWNSGKRFQLDYLNRPAARIVSTAIAVSCARHLLKLKFTYIGKLTMGTVTVPMVGFSKLAF